MGMRIFSVSVRVIEKNVFTYCDIELEALDTHVPVHVVNWRRIEAEFQLQWTESMQNKQKYIKRCLLVYSWRFARLPYLEKSILRFWASKKASTAWLSARRSIGMSTRLKSLQTEEKTTQIKIVPS